MKPLLLAIAAAGLILAARHAKAPKPAAPPQRGEGGYLAVYLEPLSPRARALAVAIESLSAVREDGTKAPLRLRFRDLGGGDAARERLLAWGTIPEGAYAHLELRRRGAPPDAPPDRADVGFSVASKRAAVLDLQIHASAPAGEEGSPSPEFTASPPPKVASGLLGAVSSPDASVVTLFDRVSGQVSSVVSAGPGARALALDGARSRLYVALSEADAVATVDLVAGKVIATTPLRAGDEPVSLALTPDARTLLVANAGSETVGVYDASGPTLVERTRAPVASGPAYVLADPSGTRAWVFCALDDAVNVLALPGGTVAGSVASAGGPVRGVLNRAGTRLFVIHRTSPYLDVIDTGTLAVAARAYVGAGTAAIALDPQTDRIYLGFRDSDRIEIYDPGALLPVDAIRTDSGPGYMTIDPEGNNLCVLIPGSDEVVLVRLAGKAVAVRVDVPEPGEALLQGGR